MRNRITIILLFAFAIAALASNLAYAALTPAGAQIKNAATANHSDVNSNPKDEVVSNEVVTLVSTLRGVDVTPNPDSLTGVSYSVGTTDDKETEYAFTITNTGNASDTIDLSLAGQNLADGWKYEIYRDENGNGRLDEAEELSTVSDTGALPQGGTFKVIVRVSAPALPDYNKSDRITLTAISNDGIEKDTGVVTLDLSSPVVTISKSIANEVPGLPIPGYLYSYYVTVKNSDMESEALNVVVFDEIHPALELLGYHCDLDISTCDYLGHNAVEWTIPNLAPNSETTLRIPVRIREGAIENSKIENRADMHYEDLNQNLYRLTAQSKTMTVAFKAGLELSDPPLNIQVSSGGRIGLSFYVTNVGNGIDSFFPEVLAGNLQLTDGSLENIIGSITYDPREFQVTESRRFIFLADVPADAADLSNTKLRVTFKSLRDPNIIKGIEVRVTVYSPVLTLEKHVDKESARPGDFLTYGFRIDNHGHAPAASVILVDAIPDNTTYVAGSIMINRIAQTDEKDADQADFNISNTGAVTVNIPTIAAGDTVTIMFRVTVD